MPALERADEVVEVSHPSPLCAAPNPLAIAPATTGSTASITASHAPVPTVSELALPCDSPPRRWDLSQLLRKINKRSRERGETGSAVSPLKSPLLLSSFSFPESISLSFCTSAGHCSMSWLDPHRPIVSGCCCPSAFTQQPLPPCTIPTLTAFPHCLLSFSLQFFTFFRRRRRMRQPPLAMSTDSNSDIAYSPRLFDLSFLLRLRLVLTTSSSLQWWMEETTGAMKRVERRQE